MLHRIRFLPILSSFGWSILEIFDKAFFGFGKIGVRYTARGKVLLFQNWIFLTEWSRSYIVLALDGASKKLSTTLITRRQNLEDFLLNHLLTLVEI